MKNTLIVFQVHAKYRDYDWWCFLLCISSFEDDQSVCCGFVPPTGVWSKRNIIIIWGSAVGSSRQWCGCWRSAATPSSRPASWLGSTSHPVLGSTSKLRFWINSYIVPLRQYFYHLSIILCFVYPFWLQRSLCIFPPTGNQSNPLSVGYLNLFLVPW